MTQIRANGIDIEYRTLGDPSNPALILVRGLGTQMISWPQDYLDALVGAGYYVIIFDNRDVGLSQKFGDFGPVRAGAVLKARAEGREPALPYTVHDMAADPVGLMDALGIEKAHIAGMSMGGMIVQVAAATYPDRFLSATSIMSSTGAPDLPQPTPDVVAALNGVYDGDDLEGLIAFNTKGALEFTGKGRPIDVEWARENQRRAIERCYYPEGVGRQYAAVLASGDRSAICRSITIPFLVIHGTDDPLVLKEGGIDTAGKVPGAKLHLVEGMGHDLPASCCEEVTGVLVEFMKSA